MKIISRRRQQHMIGERLGNWSIFKELGRGGMGHVYLAHEEMSGRLAAIKVLAPELAREEGFLQRFQQEIKTLQQLDHPNIVRFYDADFENNVYYYAMEYVDGESLERRLAREKRLPSRDVIDAARQVCSALKLAHDHGVIHRDLKPANLLQTDAGQVKLSDFGIAKVFASGHLTATGSVVGTAEYISPEQAAGKPVTKRSDLYSLGVVLYVLLTGRPPFSGKAAIDLLHKHQFGQFDPPQSFVPDLPHEINDLVCRLMEKDPDKRPADCFVLLRELEKISAKLEQKSQSTVAGDVASHTVADQPGKVVQVSHEGPATMMSRLVRAELERQNRGGRLAQFFNHPIVLVIGLLICIAGIAYAFWPASADSLFRQGAALMKSGRLTDMDTAFRDYFEPLNERFPNHAYGKQIEDFQTHRQRERQKQEAPAASIVEPLFQRGQRLAQEGDRGAAKKIWLNITRVFAGVPAEKEWVEKANKALKSMDAQKENANRWQSVRAALKRAAKLSAEGQRAEAEAIWAGIEELFGADPSAETILQEIRTARKLNQE